MMIKVFIEKEDKTMELDHNGDANSLCAVVGVNPDTVLIVKDGVLITEADSTAGAKKIELLSVISGG